MGVSGEEGGLQRDLIREASSLTPSPSPGERGAGRGVGAVVTQSRVRDWAGRSCSNGFRFMPTLRTATVFRDSRH